MDFTNCELIKKPRKRKHCYWCNEWCEIGEPRVNISGMFEGDFFHDHYHPECKEAWSQWWKVNWRDGEGPEEGSMIRGSVELKEEWR